MTRRLLLALLLVGCSTGTGTDDDGGPAAPPDAFIPVEGGVMCATDRECDDRVACTIDRCRPGGCDHTPCLDCCDDGLVCVVGFGCRSAPETCEADADCQDEARCTLDFCDDDGTCRHDANPELCDAGEICLPAIGCIPEPPTSCESADECRVSACVGEWSCQPEFGCQFVSELDCDDGDACTVDSCTEEAGGCVNAPLDADEDGHAPTSCGGDDCDDADATVSPSATEVCDGDDEDCDGVVDEGCCEADVACTTSCGTPGRTACVDDVSSCVATEVCNGVDDDCDAMTDEGFGCVRGAEESCDVSCGTGTRTCSDTCEWGACVPPAEACNGMDDDCDGDRDEDFACERGTSESCTTSCGSMGTRACLSDCTIDTVCAPPAEVCNGVDDNCNGREDEGFACPADATRDCSLVGAWYGGTAICPDDCSGWNETACHNCGDGTVQTSEGEECDPAATTPRCEEIGMNFGSGTLSCTSSCTYDTRECSTCGNGFVDAGQGEDCDGDTAGLPCSVVDPNWRGTLACYPPGHATECTYDTRGCAEWQADGIYDSTRVDVTTCNGNVNHDFSAMTVMDDGAAGGSTLSMDALTALCPGGTAASPMVGETVEDGTRTINVCCTYLAFLGFGCDETYCFTGSFTDDDTFTGSLTMSFSSRTDPSYCAGCVDQSFDVTGTRR